MEGQRETPYAWLAAIILHRPSADLTLKIIIRKRATIAYPLRSEKPPGQHELQLTSKRASVTCRCHFGTVHRDSATKKSYSYASNETASNQDPEFRGTRLHGAADGRDGGTDEHCLLSAKSVTKIHEGQGANDGTPCEDGDNAASLAWCRLVEVRYEMRLGDCGSDDATLMDVNASHM